MLPDFHEGAEYERGFSGHYAKYIRPQLDDIERTRQEYLKKFWRASWIGTGGLLLYCGIVFMLDTREPVDKLGLIAFGAIAASIWPGYIMMKYGDHVKDKVLPHVLSFFGDMTYDSQKTIDMALCDSFGILPGYTSSKSDDYISGSLEGVGLQLSEMRLTKKSGKNSHTVFRGIFVIFEFSKPFKGHTIVVQDSGKFGNWLRDRFNKMENVRLEDPRFEKMFEVYSTDQVEARYVLTTAFMERLMELATLMKNWGKKPQTKSDKIISKLNSTAIQCAFRDRKLFLMVPCYKDLFEAGNLFSPAYSMDEIRCVLYEVWLLRRIIEVLKLNQNIGL